MYLLLWCLLSFLVPSLASGQAIDQRKVGLYIANKAGNDCSQATLEAADDAAIALGQILVLPPENRFGDSCQWTVSSNLTIDSPVLIPYDAPAPVLKVNDDITLTLTYCPVVWSDYYIADANGTTTGSITYTPGCAQCSLDGPDNFTKCATGGGSGLGDITDVFNCPFGNCSNISMADGDLLDMSAVDPTSTTEGLILPTATVDCSAAIALGQICVDPVGTLWLGDGSQSSQIASQGVTLDQAFDAGKVIDGANSEANALVIGDGNDGFKIFADTGGPRIKCFIGAGDCDIKDDIPSGQSYHLKYNGTEGITIDSNGAVTLSNNLREWKPMIMGVGALVEDSGALCATPDVVTVGSKRLIGTTCADGGTLEFTVESPLAWDGAIADARITYARGATGTLFAADIQLQCRGDDDPIDDTYTGATTGTLDFSLSSVTAAGDRKVVEATNLSLSDGAGGATCAAGDTISGKITIDSANHDATDTAIIGFALQVRHIDWSEQ